MWVGAAGIAAGNGLVTPSLNAMVSRVSSDEEQGISLGLSSSAASLARILGPALAGIIFETIGPGIPMLTGAIIVAAATLVAALALPRRND
jgi:predicted MFS family arabinose efflux permease